MLSYQSTGRGRPSVPYDPSRSARRRIATRTNALLLRPLCPPSTFIEPQALEQLNSVAIKIKRCFQQGWVVLLLFWRTRLEVRLRTGTAAYWCGFKRSVDGL